MRVTGIFINALLAKQLQIYEESVFTSKIMIWYIALIRGIGQMLKAPVTMSDIMGESEQHRATLQHCSVSSFEDSLITPQALELQ